MSDNTPDNDAARGRAAALVSLIDLLGETVDAEVVQRAAFVPLAPEAMAAAFNLGCLVVGREPRQGTMTAGRSLVK